MGAAPDRHLPHEKQLGQALGPRPTKNMGTPESPKISLVNTAQKAPSWTRNLFTLDVGFHGLMLGAALTVLAVVGLLLSPPLQPSAPARRKSWFFFFSPCAAQPASSG